MAGAAGAAVSFTQVEKEKGLSGWFGTVKRGVAEVAMPGWLLNCRLSRTWPFNPPWGQVTPGATGRLPLPVLLTKVVMPATSSRAR